MSFHVDTLKIKPGSCSSSRLLTQSVSDEMNVAVNGSNKTDSSVNWRMVRWAPSRFLCSLRLHGRFVFAASTIEFYIQCCSQTEHSRPTGQQVGSARIAFAVRHNWINKAVKKWQKTLFSFFSSFRGQSRILST